MLPGAEYSCCLKAAGEKHDCDRMKVAEVSKRMIEANVRTIISFIEYKLKTTNTSRHWSGRLDIGDHLGIIAKYVELLSLSLSFALDRSRSLIKSQSYPSTIRC